jgi:hypothetical protein cdifQCD_20081
MSYEDKDVLIPLRDVNVINIKTNEYFREGCETCDYGSEYIQKVAFDFDDDRHFELRFEKMYSYTLDVELFTQLLLNNYERYTEMDYGEFKSTMKDLQGRSREEIENMVQGITSEGTEATSWSPDIEKLYEVYDKMEEDFILPTIPDKGVSNLPTIPDKGGKTREALPIMVKKDVYALVKDPNDVRTKVLWDVRKHKESNDDAVIQLGEDWGRTVVKLVENGQPLYQNATGDQLASIPATTLSQNFQASVIRDTLKYVQNGLSLDEYKLQSSFDDIQLEGLTL